ncbi:MAG TPA: cystathionine gamma-synthase [Chloroflexota bacterium]|nr:cystathionine gamma-synthase [Chloroflexota bacterium]
MTDETYPGDGWGFTTRAIHVAQEPESGTGAVITPIYQTSTYAQEGIGQHRGYEYSRTGNPTRRVVEEVIASLEQGDFGLAFASGMAAEATVMNLLNAGDHVIAGDDLYGGTYRLFSNVLTRYCLEFDYVDMSDPAAVEAAIRPTTRMLWVETPTNPLLKIVDIRQVADIAHQHGARLVVDNTFATPYFQQPLTLGADIVVHSATKYLGGHSDLVMGAAVTSDEKTAQSLAFHQNAVGGIPGPFDSWLLLRGLKTLALRMKTHASNAMAVASFLEGQPGVRRVLYPGLPSHPQQELAARQMCGFGGIVTIDLEGGEAAARRFLGRSKLFLTAESLGGVESLADHPAIMTHASVPEERREAAGISGGLLRLSVGIEDEKDLIADLEQALG